MKFRSSGSEPHAAIVSEAAAWLVEFRTGDMDGEARDRFVAWLRRSPEHIQSYLEVAASWAELPTADPHGRIDVAALIARARAEADVIPLPRAAQSRKSGVAAVSRSSAFTSAGWAGRSGLRRMSTPRRVGVAAASLVVACAALALLVIRLGGEIYTTGIGEQHTVRLSDGSTVELNAQSDLRVRMSKGLRLAELRAGQALFHVAKDAARPFIVDAGNAQVRAVGTAFDVYRKRDGTVVTVVEGRVAVGEVMVDGVEGATTAPLHAARPAHISLSAGQQLTVAGNASLTPKSVDTEAATAWVQKRLVFEETSLGDVADEFNRYNTRALVIDDPELRRVRISGIYSSTDPTSLIAFLRVQPTLLVIETPQGIQIRRR